MTKRNRLGYLSPAIVRAFEPFAALVRCRGTDALGSGRIRTDPMSSSRSERLTAGAGRARRRCLPAGCTMMLMYSDSTPDMTVEKNLTEAIDQRTPQVALRIRHRSRSCQHDHNMERAQRATHFSRSPQPPQERSHRHVAKSPRAPLLPRGPSRSARRIPKLFPPASPFP